MTVFDVHMIQTCKTFKYRFKSISIQEST